jgi:hypothetical protein
VSWPLAARAQQAERMRRIGVLMVLAESDPQSRRRIIAFQQGLEKLGWTVGRNLAIDYRWGVSDPEQARATTSELLGLAPDLILAKCRFGPTRGATGNAHGSDRFHGGQRAGRPGFRCEPGTSRRQHHRIHESGTERGRQVGGVAQGHRAACHARCSHVQPGVNLHCRTIRPFRGGGGCEIWLRDGRSPCS